MMTLGYLSSINNWRQWIASGMPAADDTDLFSKHTDYNRCVIDSPNGPLTLVLPVQKFKGKSCKLTDVLISSHGNWRHKHWHALESTYFNSPYFEFYQDELQSVYFGKQERLIDFNAQLNTLLIDMLGLSSLDYTDIEIFKNRIHPSFTNRKKYESYYQVFAHKHGFISGLSIIDLVLNMGSESVLYLF